MLSLRNQGCSQRQGPQPGGSGTVQEPSEWPFRIEDSSFLVSLGEEQFERKMNTLFRTKKSWGTVLLLSEDEIEGRIREMSKNRWEKRR